MVEVSFRQDLHDFPGLILGILRNLVNPVQTKLLAVGAPVG